MSNIITSNEHFLKRARNIRNELLNKTDRYMLEDYPNLTQDQLKSIKDYRHALREFININKENILTNGKTPDFPPQPEFININIIY
jgi:hypothetical protein